MNDHTPAPRKPSAPKNLGSGGRALWRAVLDQHHPLTQVQIVQLTEACRMKDRLDKLDAVLSGDVDTWMLLEPVDLDGTEFRVQVAGALTKANDTANAMKQLLAALRLPDGEGRVPQRRGPRGAQKPTVTGGAEQKPARVSSLERARRAKTGA